MHLPSNACKSNISSRDSPEIDVKEQQTEVCCLSDGMDHHMPNEAFSQGLVTQHQLKGQGNTIASCEEPREGAVQSTQGKGTE